MLTKATILDGRKSAKKVVVVMSKQSPPKLSLSINDASEASGIGRTKLYEAINAGSLVARKFGKRTVILLEDLEAFLKGLNTISPKSGEVENG